MPLLTQPSPPSQRRRPWLWGLLGVPGTLALLVVGLVAWGCFTPVVLRVEGRGLLCGYAEGAPAGPSVRVAHDSRETTLIVPIRERGHSGAYVIQWRWRRLR